MKCIKIYDKSNNVIINDTKSVSKNSYIQVFNHIKDNLTIIKDDSDIILRVENVDDIIFNISDKTLTTKSVSDNIDRAVIYLDEDEFNVIIDFIKNNNNNEI